MQSGTLKDDQHTESAFCFPLLSIIIIMRRDCCGSCSVDWHLHKDEPIVTNDCIQDLWAPCVHGGKLFTKIFMGGTVGGGEGPNNYVVVLKEIIFNCALCIKQIKKGFLRSFPIWMPSTCAFTSPRLCNTFNIEHSPNTEPVSRDRVYNFILDVCACVCVYIYYKESMFMIGNIFKFQMDPLPLITCPPFSMWWCHVSNAYQSCTVTVQCVEQQKQSNNKAKPGWWIDDVAAKDGFKKEIISKHLYLCRLFVCLVFFFL